MLNNHYTGKRLVISVHAHSQVHYVISLENFGDLQNDIFF